MLNVLIVALIQVQPVPLPVEPELTQEEIVVMGERLKRFKFETRRDHKTGAMMCRVTKSSGYPELDRLACDVALPCSESANSVAEFRTCYLPRMSTAAKAWTVARRTARLGRGK